MSETVLKAIRKNKKAMISLYEENRRKVYFITSLLFENEQERNAVNIAVWRDFWDRLSDKKLTGERDATDYLTELTAKRCRNRFFSADEKVMKLPKNIVRSTFELGDEEFDGDASAALEAFMNASRSLDKLKRFIFVMHLAGDISFDKLSLVLKIRSSAVKSFFGAASASLYENLDGVSVHALKSLFDLSCRHIDLPETTDGACRDMIDKLAITPESHKKLIIVLCIAVCATVLALWVGFASGNDDAETTGTETEAVTEAEEETASVTDTNALDSATDSETVSYYADIVIEDYGTITVALDSEAAPVTVENFVSLAEADFYDGLTFHRIIEDFMMQGGDPNGDGTGGSDEEIVGEFTNNGYDNDLSHTRGAISMARSDDYDSASSQFFIVHEDSTSLDGDYAVFGYVTEGMDVVDAVCESAEPTDGNGTIPASEQPVITDVVIRTK